MTKKNKTVPKEHQTKTGALIPYGGAYYPTAAERDANVKEELKQLVEDQIRKRACN